MREPTRFRDDERAPDEVRALFRDAGGPPRLEPSTRRRVAAGIAAATTTKLAMLALAAKVTAAVTVTGAAGVAVYAVADPAGWSALVADVSGTGSSPSGPAHNPGRRYAGVEEGTSERDPGSAAGRPPAPGAKQGGPHEEGAPPRLGASGAPTPAGGSQTDSRVGTADEAANARGPVDATHRPEGALPRSKAGRRTASDRAERQAARRGSRHGVGAAPHRAEHEPASQAPAPVRQERVSTLEQEAAWLEDARRAVDRDPRRALRLTAAHPERFPRGQLGAERELIAARALQALGQLEHARARLSAWLEAHPRGLHARRMRRLLEHAGAAHPAKADPAPE